MNIPGVWSTAGVGPGGGAAVFITVWGDRSYI